jgi:CRISPR-associated exonuclease Cas4
VHPDPLPISALQHLLFCERQCALIHIEGLWAENRLTVEGQSFHRRAHGERAGPRGGGLHTTRAGVRTVRGMPLECRRLGLVGKADVVEFHADTGDRSGPAVPFPIEYKRGRPKSHHADEVQLCAQALCLEEMLGVRVPRGALFYGRTRRRHEVVFGADIRDRTECAAVRLHEMIALGITPRAVREAKCDRCSLLDLCLPGGTGPGRSAARYTSRALAGASRDSP